MSSLRSGAFNLLKTSRLISGHQASISRSALLFSDLQVRDKLKEAKQVEVSKEGEKSMSLTELMDASKVTSSPKY